MRSAVPVIILVVLLAIAVRAAFFSEPERWIVRAEISLAEMMGREDDSDFLRADVPRSFSFPEDHGPHPGFRTEWWYFTGNLQGPGGRAFGYQFTLFRNSLATEPVERESSWGAHEIYMGHLGVTDVGGGRFESFERFSRGTMGLAGAQADPFRVWLEDWSVRETGDGVDAEGFAVRIEACAEGVELRLELNAVKPVVLQGNAGLSAKGPEPGNASYYYSITRLETRGDLVLGDESFAVRGLSWLDREWSTSALGDDLAGWDWFALQLSDGTDLMYYMLRLEQGGAAEQSKGTIVMADGRNRPLDHKQVEVTVLDTWESPLGGIYPSAWRIAIPSEGLDVTVTPLIEGQEHDFSIRYWEGAVTVEGTRSGAQVKGTGYVELTGYDASGKDG